MFRQAYETAARLLTRRAALTPVREIPTSGPPVHRLPNPRDARWRRWAKRSRAAGYRLPLPRDEECWRVPTRPGPPLREVTEDPVRTYVLRR